MRPLCVGAASASLQARGNPGVQVTSHEPWSRTTIRRAHLFRRGIEALEQVAPYRGDYLVDQFGALVHWPGADVGRQRPADVVELPPQVEVAPDWAERVRAAHAEGYGVVAGAIDWNGTRRPRALAAYTPGPGRVPGFAGPLLAPSVLPGIALERLDDVEGLPAYAAPRDEPWVYDGRIVLKVRRT